MATQGVKIVCECKRLVVKEGCWQLLSWRPSLEAEGAPLNGVDSKKGMLAAVLVRLSLYCLPQSQEEDFRLQNRTFMEELSKVIIPYPPTKSEVVIVAYRCQVACSQNFVG